MLLPCIASIHAVLEVERHPQHIGRQDIRVAAHDTLQESVLPQELIDRVEPTAGPDVRSRSEYCL